MVLEKGSPRLRRWLPLSDHVFRDCRLRNLDSNLQQFPMNARSTPARVSEAHLTDQIPNFSRHCWAAFATPTLPRPIEARTPAMPGDNGLRLDNEQCRSPIVPQTCEPNRQDSVSPTEAELVRTARTLQDQELMSESKNLCLRSGPGSEPVSRRAR